MPIILIILFLIALYVFWDYVIYLIGGAFVLGSLLFLSVAYDSFKDRENTAKSSIIFSLIIALISGGIGYKIIDYNNNKRNPPAITEQAENTKNNNDDSDIDKKIEQLSSEEKELYNTKYHALLQDGKNDIDAKKDAYYAVMKVRNINIKTDNVKPEFKELFNERHQTYLSEGLADIDAKEKALIDVANKENEIKTAKAQEEKRLAKEQELNKKIATLNDEEKSLFDTKYATLSTNMDDLTAREKALSDVKTTIEENKKRAVKEFLENEQPFKKEAEARHFSAAHKIPWKVHQMYEELMVEYAKNMRSGNDDTKEAREACLAYYAGKGAEDMASYDAEKKGVSLDKLQTYLKSREFNETAEKGEKEIQRLASWSGANLE